MEPVDSRSTDMFDLVPGERGEFTVRRGGDGLVGVEAIIDSGLDFGGLEGRVCTSVVDRGFK